MPCRRQGHPDSLPAPMHNNPNDLQWNGEPGHYEVYYVTVTDPATGIGFWIRYTMLAPVGGHGGERTSSLWFLAMDPQNGVFGRKATLPLDELSAQTAPFE